MLGFSLIVVAENPYTQQQPADCAEGFVLVSGCGARCRLVVEQTASDQNWSTDKREEVNLIDVTGFLYTKASTKHTKNAKP